MSLDSPICPTLLTGSVARTLLLFREYQPQLGKIAATGLTSKFFEHFVRTWGLGRTIGKSKREEIRKRLNGGDLKRLEIGNAAAVEEIAARYCKCKLSAKSNRSGQSHRIPRSLVAKVGFLANPNYFVPYDTYAKKGLNLRRGLVRDGGLGHLADDYCSYFESFEKCFVSVRDLIVSGCSESWVRGLADQLYIPQEIQCCEGFYRKVLDDVLMTEGGWGQ